MGIYFLIFVLILQQIDGNLIGPKILGDSTGISSFWVVLSIVVGGKLFAHHEFHAETQTLKSVEMAVSEFTLHVVAVIGGIHEGAAAAHIRSAGKGEVIKTVYLEFHGRCAVGGRQCHARGQKKSKEFFHSIPSHCCLAPPAETFPQDE